MAPQTVTTLSKTAFSFSILVLFVSLPHTTALEGYTFDLKVEYFTDVTMLCDHPQLNISERASEVQSLSWMFPDGAVVDSTTVLNPKLFMLSGPSPEIAAYNLTALHVSDEVYGYYTCIVVYNSPAKPISVIRWGLNVNGADFSALLETYEQNAIIGGIAAGAMLVLVGGACLIWHFRYSNRHNSDVKKGAGDGSTNANDVTQQKSHVMYTNKSYTVDDDMSEIDLHSNDRK